MNFFRTLFALIVFTGSFGIASAQQLKSPIAGPLVGPATPASVTLWMHAGEDSQLEVQYQTDVPGAESHSANFQSVANPSTPQVVGSVATVTLGNLRPDTRYNYQVVIDGKSNPKREGTFKTAPVAGKGAKFRIGLTSCMKIGHQQSSWELFRNDKPDFHLTLGDTHYANTTDPNKQLEHHLAYRQQPEFASVIRTIPTFAMWDDHDYGPNNSDGTENGKENSLAGWRQFWGNPATGTATTPGAFFKFSWGDVEFFVVDSRYYRSPNHDEDDNKKRMLGDEQFAWLLDGLKASTAKFKVIASGSTLNHSLVDGWRIYTFSRHRLFDAIKENRIGGVVYMSGDIHSSLVWEHPESCRVGYPLVEVISSGVANSETLSYATIDFDTLVDDPTMRVRVVQGDGKTTDDKAWKLSELQME